MISLKSIRPLNDIDQRHGFWGVYNINGDTLFKAFYQNDKIVGYCEEYCKGELESKTFFLK